MYRTEAMEVLDSEGVLVAHYCSYCGEREVQDAPNYGPTDRVSWVSEGDQDRNWTCDGCGSTIKRESKRGSRYSSNVYTRMGQVLNDKHYGIGSVR